MPAFDDSSISHRDVGAFQSRGLALQIATVRQIDRIFSNSGSIYIPESAENSFAHSKAVAKNMRFQTEFLARLLTPYVGKEMPSTISRFSRLLKDAHLNGPSDLETYLDILLKQFGEVTIQLGHVDLLPPIDDELESGRD